MMKNDNGLDIKVFFSNSDIYAKDFPDNNVIIWIKNDSWNDFGYRARCNFKFHLNYDDSTEAKIIEGELLLGFSDGESDLSDILSECAKENRSNIITSDRLPQFFTMLPDMQSYRNIVDFEGIEVANVLLKSINDLVFTKNQPKTKSNRWLDDAINSKIFTLSFMRNSETFYAFHNASTILNGLNEERLGLMSSELVLEFKLDAFKNNHKVNFKFEHDNLIPSRVAVLIGENGTGKSQALRQVVKGLVNFDENSYLIDPHNQRPLISRLLAIATPGETSTTFPKGSFSNQDVYYKRLELDRDKVAEDSHGLGEMLVELARSKESIKNKSRWELFYDALSQTLPIDEIVVPLKKEPAAIYTGINVNGNCYVYLEGIRSNNGEQATLEVWNSIYTNAEPLRLSNGNITPLSSGQITFFKFALQACLYIENGTLVLLDEPETHLHPGLIKKFVGLLDEILENTGSISIIATHSVYFVREVSRKQVFVFKQVEEQITISNPRLKTFGADVGAISYFVFEEDDNSRLYEKLEKSIFDGDKNIDELLDKLKEELSTEAIMSIKRKFKNNNEKD